MPKLHTLPQPPEVRILPMDSVKEFKTLKAVREFFLKELPLGECDYCYRKSGLNTKSGAIVLFQFKAKLVALAKYKDIESWNSPKSIDNRLYYGRFFFNASSIMVFDPISLDVVQNTGRRSSDSVRQSLDWTPGVTGHFGCMPAAE